MVDYWGRERDSQEIPDRYPPQLSCQRGEKQRPYEEGGEKYVDKPAYDILGERLPRLRATHVRIVTQVDD